MPRKHKHTSEMQPWLKIHGHSVDLSWRHMAFDCLVFSIHTRTLWCCIMDEKTHSTLLNGGTLCAFSFPSPSSLTLPPPPLSQRLNCSIRAWLTVLAILSQECFPCLRASCVPKMRKAPCPQLSWLASFLHVSLTTYLLPAALTPARQSGTGELTNFYRKHLPHEISVFFT